MDEEEIVKESFVQMKFPLDRKDVTIIPRHRKLIRLVSDKSC